MTKPLMPKATAVWMVDNTALTFDQIADFCGLHVLEVQGIADGEVASGMQGMDPVANGQVTQAEIERCQKDPKARLRVAQNDLPKPLERTKGPKYTPIAKRQEKPDAIAWILRNHPEIKDTQVCKLIGTTKTTIQAIRDRSHWNIQNIHPHDPVLLGICTQSELNEIVEKARAQRAKDGGNEPLHEVSAFPSESDSSES